MITQEIKDLVDLLSKLAIPLLVFAFGFVLVRSVERQKAKAVRASDFTKKWADSFAETSYSFVNSSEKFLSILVQLQSHPPESVQNKFLEEIWNLTVSMGEECLRIERLSKSALQHGEAAISATQSLQNALHRLLQKQVGNIDQIKELQAVFTEAVRNAHSEMLRIA